VYPSLNESPSEKEGKCRAAGRSYLIWCSPSMKVPPKRKGNLGPREHLNTLRTGLNESPSQKEGKSWSEGIPYRGANEPQ